MDGWMEIIVTGEDGDYSVIVTGSYPNQLPAETRDSPYLTLTLTLTLESCLTLEDSPYYNQWIKGCNSNFFICTQH